MEISILHQDDHLLVVDKPHFLPTTPGGTYIQESALVRLRNQLDLPDLIPMHRLDRMTAGVLLLSTNPETRGKYQVLFEKRQVQKEYECVSAAEPAAGLSRRRLPRGGAEPDDQIPQLPAGRSHRRRAQRGDPDRTAGNVRRRQSRGRCTAVPPASAPERVARYRLEPHSGKTHQLRVHMASLGLGIVNDAFYPDLLDKAPDDYTNRCSSWPAASGSWTPSRKEPVEYRSRLQLSEAVQTPR